MNICKQPINKLLTGFTLTALTVGLASQTGMASLKQAGISGDIVVDGSSTVFPITEAMAEEFQKANPDVRITVGVSGTGGGFKKFCAGETDISNASRPIKTEEIEACAQAGIEFIELPVAFDAISVVVNPNNTWAECLTVEELNKMWAPEAQETVTNWTQIREGFPDRPLALYGPGTDSGTFDYFTDAINGEEGASRGDFTASEDDNVIVLGVANDENALGYFGLAYLTENADKIRGVKIDGGNGCVEPSVATVEDGTYQPLARPLFIYVSKSALERPQVKAFVDFYLQKENVALVEEVGYVRIPDAIYDKAQARLNNLTTGTVFGGGSTVGVNLQEVL
ncbi:PstS family phosphate ABC transporter substrate-binding protein [Gloeocapsa sp. PCC 73106]|uniref:PstS family phosphate ABC transporter substrate-binding protein n=1 Tax=Gloeocapsa sp. PCC 73106 TaxID=102232 RepID=UPI0002ACDA3B|nr:PstS family phosphate ABC transporter substrate-binding protein [Gloeocapsa sp. PCC 73106]ELR98480.1 phosphate binding protein [Gloeocapsa sp. PCC 73106]